MMTTMRFLLFPSVQAVVLVLALLGTAVPADSACFDGTSRFVKADWDFCQQLQPDLFMYYKPFTEEGNLMLGLHATQETFGWTALALAGNGGMKGASQIVVRQENGTWVAEDRHSVDYVTPVLDESQDVRLLFADQTEDGETSWAALLPMKSCDEDDYAIEDTSVYMHWAIGSDHDFGFHGTRRGQFHANLLKAPSELPSFEGLPFVDFLMPNVAVELGEGGAEPTNPYICSFFDLDQLANGTGITPGTKVHVTGLSPALDEDSKGYVHHMIL
jgi:DOMON domain